MQFGDEGLQFLLLHGFTEPGDIQTLECFLCSFRGHQFVAKATAANAPAGGGSTGGVIQKASAAAGHGARSPVILLSNW